MRIFLFLIALLFTVNANAGFNVCVHTINVFAKITLKDGSMIDGLIPYVTRGHDESTYDDCAKDEVLTLKDGTSLTLRDLSNYDGSYVINFDDDSRIITKETIKLKQAYKKYSCSPNYREIKVSDIASIDLVTKFTDRQLENISNNYTSIFIDNNCIPIHEDVGSGDDPYPKMTVIPKQSTAEKTRKLVNFYSISAYSIAEDKFNQEDENTKRENIEKALLSNIQKSQKLFNKFKSTKDISTLERALNLVYDKKFYPEDAEQLIVKYKAQLFEELKNEAATGRYSMDTTTDDGQNYFDKYGVTQVEMGTCENDNSKYTCSKSDNLLIFK